MKWLENRRKRLQLEPIPPEIIEAHQEAEAVKESARRTFPAFARLGAVMTELHRKNGVAYKLNATYSGKGLL